MCSFGDHDYHFDCLLGYFDQHYEKINNNVINHFKEIKLTDLFSQQTSHRNKVTLDF